MKHRISPAVSYIKNNSKNDQVLTIYDSTDGATCRIHILVSSPAIVNRKHQVSSPAVQYNMIYCTRSIWECCYNLKTVVDQTEN